MKVPFNKQGDQHYSVWNNSPDVDWRDIDTFEASLTFHDMHKYSSYVVTFLDEDGLRYWMSNAEFIKAVPHMVKGVLEGRFVFKKQGKYFSISYDGKS